MGNLVIYITTIIIICLSLFQINNIASLFIQDIIGVDISSQLYSIEKDFDILKNFTEAISKLDKQKSQPVNWKNVFNVADDSEFIKMFKQRSLLGKHML